MPTHTYPMQRPPSTRVLPKGAGLFVAAGVLLTLLAPADLKPGVETALSTLLVVGLFWTSLRTGWKAPNIPSVLLPMTLTVIPVMAWVCGGYGLEGAEKSTVLSVYLLLGLGTSALAATFTMPINHNPAFDRLPLWALALVSVVLLLFWLAAMYYGGAIGGAVADALLS